MAPAADGDDTADGSADGDGLQGSAAAASGAKDVVVGVSASNDGLGMDDSAGDLPWLEPRFRAAHVDIARFLAPTARILRDPRLDVGDQCEALLELFEPSSASEDPSFDTDAFVDSLIRTAAKLGTAADAPSIIGTTINTNTNITNITNTSHHHHHHHHPHHHTSHNNHVVASANSPATSTESSRSGVPLLPHYTPSSQQKAQQQQPLTSTQTPGTTPIRRKGTLPSSMPGRNRRFNTNAAEFVPDFSSTDSTPIISATPSGLAQLPAPPSAAAASASSAAAVSAAVAAAAAAAVVGIAPPSNQRNSTAGPRARGFSGSSFESIKAATSAAVSNVNDLGPQQSTSLLSSTNMLSSTALYGTTTGITLDDSSTRLHQFLSLHPQQQTPLVSSSSSASASAVAAVSVSAVTGNVGVGGNNGVSAVGAIGSGGSFPRSAQVAGVFGNGLDDYSNLGNLSTTPSSSGRLSGVPISMISTPPAIGSPQASSIKNTDSQIKLLMEVVNQKLAEIAEIADYTPPEKLIHQAFPTVEEDVIYSMLSHTSYDVKDVCNALRSGSITVDSRHICRHFLQSNCRRSDCPYSHDIQWKVCKFWINGSCLKGDECEFMHGIDVFNNIREDLSKALESLYEKALFGTTDVLAKQRTAHLQKKMLETEFPTLGAAVAGSKETMPPTTSSADSSRQGTSSLSRVSSAKGPQSSTVRNTSGMIVGGGGDVVGANNNGFGKRTTNSATAGLIGGVSVDALASAQYY